MFILFFYWYFYYRIIDKIKPLKSDSTLARIKKPGILKRIFYMFPKQLSYDILTQDPDAFNDFGIHIVCGHQGAGKTVTACYLIREWQRKYSKLKVYSNIKYDRLNGRIEKWQDLLLNNNGIYGCVNFIDEIQVWFSSVENSKLPPQLLGEISQQRKQKKAIVGTAQVFSKVSKALREQTHFVYLPRTYFNCITVVWRTRAEDYDADKNKFKGKKGVFFFVHDKELRECYDTFEKVQKYTETEFASSLLAGTAPSVMEESS